MWKYVSRRIRDTFERSANYFDKRGTTGVVNTPANINDDKNKRPCPQCCWFSSRNCWNSTEQANNTNQEGRWNFEHLTSSWIGAITWSSALVLGWYSSQLIHFKYKYQSRKYLQQCPSPVLSSVYPYVKAVKNETDCSKPGSKIEEIIAQFTPTAYMVSNDQHEVKNERTTSIRSESTNTDDSTNVLGVVLNSIENKLGLAAIQNGQLKDGLNLLRSAANRNYAPALYNLGLCHEMGTGVSVDEKMAMELYRAAAALEHPGALYNLGIYYAQGRGGLCRDTNTAARLLRLAAVQGQQNAIDALKILDLDTVETPSSQNSYPLNYMINLPFQNDSIVPTPTILYVENDNYMQPQKYDTIVY